MNKIAVCHPLCSPCKENEAVRLAHRASFETQISFDNKEFNCFANWHWSYPNNDYGEAWVELDNLWIFDDDMNQIMDSRLLRSISEMISDLIEHEALNKF